MLVPVRIFDDHLGARIHRLGGSDDQLAPRVFHQLEPELRPAARALGGDVGIRLRGDEEKIVEDDLVEVPRGQLGDLLHEGPVRRIRIAEGAEVEFGRRAGEGDAAGDAHAVIEEEFFHVLDQGLIRQVTVAMGFDVDLVDLELAADPCPLSLSRPGSANRFTTRTGI